MYLLAIFCPPLAVLLSGKPFQALINCGLCILLYLPAIIHAWMVVKESKADKRNKKLIKAINKSA
jgi:uncharacterized membrane protein YqaE (UPF0057 family)